MDFKINFDIYGEVYVYIKHIPEDSRRNILVSQSHGYIPVISIEMLIVCDVAKEGSK